MDEGYIVEEKKRLADLERLCGIVAECFLTQAVSRGYAGVKPNKYLPNGNAGRSLLC